jgi:hypothetical protein
MRPLSDIMKDIEAVAIMLHDYDTLADGTQQRSNGRAPRPRSLPMITKSRALVFGTDVKLFGWASSAISTPPQSCRPML